MQQGKKPTRTQWPIFRNNGLDSREWLVQKIWPDKLQVVNVKTQEIREIYVDVE